MLRVGLPLVAASVLALPAATPAPGIETAFHYLYSFDFRAAQQTLDRLIASRPRDPLPYGLRAAGHLFFELDRLRILESEFFADDKKIIDKKKLRPDPAVRGALFRAVEDAQSRATAVLAANPKDHDALFAMALTLGVVTDYTALVEKRQLASLSTARRSYRYARELLRNDPGFYDAYLTTGVTEYLVGSLPFFLRWFVRFEDVRGSKDLGIRNLQLVAESGRYLRPFARILLAIVHLREKRLRETKHLLEELAREYPANPLFRKELAKVSARLP